MAGVTKNMAGIGDHVGFIYKGELVWVGDRNNILTATHKELNEFVFASNMAKKMKEMMEISG